MKTRWKLAVKVAGWIGGASYRRTFERVGRLAEDQLTKIDLVPDLEEKCVWYMVESHLTPERSEKMDSLLGIFMIWRYQP
jgi:hypothetical protein